MRVDDRNRDLRPAVERPPDLSAGTAHDLERFLENRLYLGAGKGACDVAGGGGAADGLTVGARADGEDEGVRIVEFGRRRRATARRLGAVGPPGDEKIGRAHV